MTIVEVDATTVRNDKCIIQDLPDSSSSRRGKISPHVTPTENIAVVCKTRKLFALWGPYDEKVVKCSTCRRSPLPLENSVRSRVGNIIGVLAPQQLNIDKAAVIDRSWFCARKNNSIDSHDKVSLEMEKSKLGNLHTGPIRG